MTTASMISSETLSPAQWSFYQENGYLRLGKLLSDDQVAALQNRIDSIMLGTAEIDYPRLMMQLDSNTGKYEDAGVQSLGHKSATLEYRKIEKLELDPLFLEFMRHPIFQEICRRVYGSHIPIASFRAMFMNKPAQKGTFLPWHQDRWVYLDRDPLMTSWTALDPATVANGCVQIIPGSHKVGLINPAHYSGFLTQEQAAANCTPDKIVYLELAAGETVLLHNHLLHASDMNRTDLARRAFSVCYMDARTTSTTGESYFDIFP